LYRKKDKVNKNLYKAHLIVSQERGNLWHPTLETIQDSINSIMDKKYKTLHDKLNKLENTQKKNSGNPNLVFHPRVINHTNISFSPDEIKLLKVV